MHFNREDFNLVFNGGCDIVFAIAQRIECFSDKGNRDEKI
jgi:hypothetical protein